MQEYLAALVHFQQEQFAFYQQEYLGFAYTMAQGRCRITQADIEGMLRMREQEEAPLLQLPGDDAAVCAKYGIAGDFVLLQCGSGIIFKGAADTRNWPMASWESLVRRLKRERPQLLVVQLGAAYHTPIPGCDLHLLGRTSLREAICLLRAARLLIAHEGGFPFMRYFFAGKVSCVMYGPTDAHFYGIPGNINLSSGACSGCEVHRDWFRRCLRGDAVPRCMAALSPEAVYERIAPLL